MRRAGSGCGIILSFAAWVYAAELPRKAAFQSDSYVVLINATVLDRMGRPVTGLTQDRFHIFQDKAQRQITYFAEEEVPVSLAIIFDASGSMNINIAGARKALRALLEESNFKDEFCLITVAKRPELTVPWGSNDALVQNSAAFRPPHGQTALLDAIHLALDQTRKASNPRRAILVLSDGGENNSRYTEHDIAAALEEGDAQMYAVDMTERPYYEGRTAEEMGGPDLLSRLSERGGGRYFAAHDDRELRAAADCISKELRSEYVLGFVPPNGLKDGKFHHVQLRVERDGRSPKLSVYWRPGYRIPTNN